jgi:siroheme decarboxylase
MDFNPVESAVLNRIQRDFPLTESPFEDMAHELTIDGSTLVSTVKDMKERGIVRNIAGIFNPGRLGFVSSLVAFRLDEKDIERAALLVNEHPGVSHNYRRDHEFNLWFTLSSESPEKLAKTVEILADRTGARDTLILKNERLLKIGFMLSIGDDDSQAPEVQVHHDSTGPEDHGLSADQKEAVRLLQIDMPLEQRPFRALVEHASGRLDEQALIRQARRLKTEGVLRRYSAVLRHRKAGYGANAMTVWRPGNNADVDTLIEHFREEPTISHLYLRTIYPGKWEYPLFAMIHTRTDRELDGIITRLAAVSAITDYRVLRSLKEYKKERVVYYSPALGEWERKAGL